MPSMNRFSSLRVRLVAVVFLAVMPALALMVYARQSWLWIGFLLGLLSLTAAWIGGELFILRQIRALVQATKYLTAGNFASRSGLSNERSELGDLARAFDAMADGLERQTREREQTERALLNRAHRQTVIAALGQFALTATEPSAFLNQVVLLISQTLEVEYCMVLESDPDGKILTMRAGIGWREELLDLATVEPADQSEAVFTLNSGEPVVIRDMRVEDRFQAPVWFLEHGIVSGASVVIQGHDRPFGVLGVHTIYPRDFTEEEVLFLSSAATLLALAIDRQRTEPELQKLAAFAKFNPYPVLEFSAEGRLTYFNAAAHKIAAQLRHRHPSDLLPPGVEGIVQTCLALNQNRLRLETRHGSHTLSWSFFPILPSQVVHCYVEDITERLNLEEQFRQAQKMESVGQLAAGVAHDFNNILTIIQGHSGLLMARPNLSPAMTASIQAVSFAAERAASLTRQLLMFSRKQVMQPKVLDLNGVVDNMAKMLQRLLGSAVNLNCQFFPDLPSIQGDAGMMEQILMNLAVNARDAMPKGGELLISTTPAHISADYVKQHPDAREGLFVCLQIKDTGCGIDPSTMKRIFEPFFTTKEAGKGTGLGLATVYGIVKQHSGWIEVNSHEGHGTAFNIFLPAIERPAESGEEDTTPSTQVRGGSETILVVEDESSLRNLAHLILQDCGYNVLEAASGVEALTVWQRHDQRIDLLLTDMIMPDGLSGKDLAESLLALKPRLKVIFTSGYDIEAIGAEHGNGNEFKYLQKPYSRFTLAKAIRDCLDA
jgi:signal transduction histidine kinase/HAMP domain-containing protein